MQKKPDLLILKEIILKNTFNIYTICFLLVNRLQYMCAIII